MPPDPVAWVLNSGAEPSPALGAPCTQHFAAGGGTHAGTEPVYAFALDNAGLKCSFHGSALDCGTASAKGGKLTDWAAFCQHKISARAGPWPVDNSGIAR